MRKLLLVLSQLSILFIVQIVSLQLSVAAPSEEQKSTDTETTTLEDVKKEVADAFASIGRFSADQRDQAAEAARRDLDQLDSQMDKLEDQMNRKWDQFSEETRENWLETREALKKKRVEAAEWYGGVKRGSADAWDEIKKGYDDALSDLSKAWQKAKKDFTTKEKKEEGNTI